jgi:hypothetical protein
MTIQATELLQLFSKAEKLDLNVEVREALNHWGTPEPIALEDREPQQTDLNEEYRCWWWDDSDGVWEIMRGDDRGLRTIRKSNEKLDHPHRWTHWMPYWAIKEPKEKE